MTRRTLIFDHTAIALLFDNDEIVVRYWERAEQGELTIIFPALAVAEAGRQVKAQASAWTPLLWPEHVQVVPLGEVAATEIGTWPGDLVTCHVWWEARQVDDAIIVTRTPELYRRGGIPVLAV